MDFFSATWEQPEHTKICTMVVAFTNVERDHFIEAQRSRLCAQRQKAAEDKPANEDARED